MTLPTGEHWARAATPGPWADQAACRGEIDLFFAPTRPHYETPDARVDRIGQAVATCYRCPVRLQCLDFAVTNDEQHGIWGGENRDKTRPGRYRKAVA